jgi:hypothetical protein
LPNPAILGRLGTLALTAQLSKLRFQYFKLGNAVNHMPDVFVEQGIYLVGNSPCCSQ